MKGGVSSHMIAIAKNTNKLVTPSNQLVTDTLQRPLRDLRISLTDQCNFRCTYCMPKEIFGPKYQFLKKQNILNFDELMNVVKGFVDCGVKKIRLTGGEPLLRAGICDFIKQLKTIPEIEDIALTTNGEFLPPMAKKLKEAGLDRVTISLDAISDQIFSEMNGRNLNTDKILLAIDSARDAGLAPKVNMVVIKGVNDHDIMPMVNFFKDKKTTLRFIEFMDVGNHNKWNKGQVISGKEILDLIKKSYAIEPVDASYLGEVAKRYRFIDDGTEFGLITSVSQSFCSDCSRARISADGKVYTCLFSQSGTDLLEPIRSGASVEETTQLIKNIWTHRHDRYSELRDEIISRMQNNTKIESSYIGG